MIWANSVLPVYMQRAEVENLGNYTPAIVHVQVDTTVQTSETRARRGFRTIDL
jgi:hypothetical protein